MDINVKQISKNYGSFQALKEVNLTIPSGKITALLGPSGSGKTTLLRMIAGLEMPDSGGIYFGDHDYTTKTVRERNVGFVFQHYALFHHMNVFENIAFGLKVRPRKDRPSKQDVQRKVNELLHLVQLNGLDRRYPAQLSGGQRQRVALARALAVEPNVLLLDEPFGALDAKVRQELRRWLRQLHEQLHVTTVFVTHDQEEALEVADQVVILNNGQIEQVGTPDEVYQHPKTKFVYQFLGRVNVFHAEVNDGRLHIGEALFAAPDENIQTKKMIGYIRPHEVRITRHNDHQKSIQVKVRRIQSYGPIVRLELERLKTNDLIEVDLSVEQANQLNVKNDEILYADLEKIKFFSDSPSVE
ncbi:sulfate ABC transporter ATP-binding protein [Aeribacillus sp. FSL K6-1121]|uniref:sulfate/molybdate ABC transporter ATP-binding protein n=1 Tax=unclassified Aeribacillus TaxID=2640495 RepID=UPI0030DC95AD